MSALLKWLGINFEREYCLGETLFTLDFYIATHRLGIEVDGSIHDAGKPGELQRKQNAERKEALCRCMGITLIRIHHGELVDDDLSAVINKIQEIVGIGGAGNQGRKSGFLQGEPR